MTSGRHVKLNVCITATRMKKFPESHSPSCGICLRGLRRSLEELLLLLLLATDTSMDI